MSRRSSTTTVTIPPRSSGRIAATRERFPGAVVRVLFQPHLYSRTRHLAWELAESLAGADDITVTGIYGAREQPIEGVTGKLVVDALSDRGILAGWTPRVESGVERLRRRASLVTCCWCSAQATSIAPSACSVRREGRSRPLAYTTIGTGGPARWFEQPETIPELGSALAWAQEHGVPVEVIGLGSNLLVHDDGVEALVLKLAGELAGARVEDGVLVAGGGASNAVCLHRARAAGLVGSSSRRRSRAPPAAGYA